MVSKHSDYPAPTATTESKVPLPVKIVVAGGFAVGKTTFVNSISEIEPLATEAVMTRASESIDDMGSATSKESTTVAMDFGRITLGNNDLILYLFGTPGQERFHFMWNDLVRGAIGAVVLVDTSRLSDCFPAVDYFEQRGVPFIVAVNCFNGGVLHDLDDVRAALALRPDVPAVYTDARMRAATRDALLMLVQHALARSI